MRFHLWPLVRSGRGLAISQYTVFAVAVVVAVFHRIIGAMKPAVGHAQRGTLLEHGARVQFASE